MLGLECLIAAIFFEARGEPISGKMAVAEVVMNRVQHEDFPDSVCSVVYEPRQFSFTHDGMSDNPDDYGSYKDNKSLDVIKFIAMVYLNKEKEGLGISSTHYHNTDVSPFWADAYEMDGQVGKHIFYTCDTNKRNC